MAISKKTTSKKTPTKKASVNKTVAAKAPTTKKVSTAKKATTKNAASRKNQKMRSFRVSADYPSFTTFKITRQTVYWIILVAFIIFVQLWILKLQIEVSDLIEAQLRSLDAGM